MLYRMLFVALMMLEWPGTSLMATVEGGGPIAESARKVTVGSRVRVSSPAGGDGPVIGTVVALEPGVVVLGDDKGPRARVPVTPSTTLEVSGGKKSQAGRGAMIGAAVGAVPGLLMTVGDYNTDKGNPAAVSLGGAAAGAGVGALIGLLLKSEEWRPAEMPAVTAAIAPLPRGAAISFRVMWGGNRQ